MHAVLKLTRVAQRGNGPRLFLDSGVEQLTSRFIVDDLAGFEELTGANGVKSL